MTLCTRQLVRYWPIADASSLQRAVPRDAPGAWCGGAPTGPSPPSRTSRTGSRKAEARLPPRADLAILPCLSLSAGIFGGEQPWRESILLARHRLQPHAAAGAADRLSDRQGRRNGRRLLPKGYERLAEDDVTEYGHTCANLLATPCAITHHPSVTCRRLFARCRAARFDECRERSRLGAVDQAAD